MKMVTEKILALPVIRRIIQILMVGGMGKWAFYGIFRCPFLVPFVNCQNCPVLTCWGRLTAYFYTAWLIIPISAILIGRTFCGWICPVGFVNQLLGKFSLFKMRQHKRIFRLGQLGMVCMIITCAYIYFILDNPRMMIPIRTGEFFNSIYLIFQHASPYWMIRTVLIIAFIVGSLLVANAWCRFICPAGGLFEIVKKISLFGIRKSSACDGCNACSRVCEMGTRPGEMNCNNCGNCLNVCHKNAIYWGKKKKYE